MGIWETPEYGPSSPMTVGRLPPKHNELAGSIFSQGPGQEGHREQRRLDLCDRGRGQGAPGGNGHRSVR
jgi:hypothetical protein